MLAVLSVFAILILLAYKWTNISFWLAIMLFIDPGGYINYLFNLPEIRFILPFYIAFMPLLTNNQYRKNILSADNKPVKLFYPFIVYALFFYFLLLNKENLSSIKDLLYLGIYSSILILIPIIYKNVYITTIRNPILPIYIFTIYASVVGILFILSTQFGYKLINVATGTREGLQRIIIYQYGNYLFIPFIFMILLKLPKNNKRLSMLIVSTALFGLIILIYDMSRGQYVYMALILILLFFTFFRLRLMSKIGKSLITISVILLFLMLILPQYINQVSVLITNAVDSSSEREELRFTLNLEQHKILFRKNPVFGHGYTRKWYDNGYDDYGASDLPLTGGIAMFGIVGTSLYLYFVVGLIKHLYKRIMSFKKLKPQGIDFNMSLVVVFFITIIGKYLLPFYYFQDIIRPQLLLTYFTFIAIGMGYYRIYINDLASKST